MRAKANLPRGGGGLHPRDVGFETETIDQDLRRSEIGDAHAISVEFKVQSSKFKVGEAAPHLGL
jgi:hypothetical protein